MVLTHRLVQSFLNHPPQIYIVVAHTYGNHIFSRQPEAFSPHCHPVRMPLDAYSGHEHIKRIATQALLSFDALDASGSLDIPEFCFLSGENHDRTWALSEILNTALLSSATALAAPQQLPQDTPAEPPTYCDPSTVAQYLKPPPTLVGNLSLSNPGHFLRRTAREVYNIAPTSELTPFNSDHISVVSDLLALAIFLEVLGSPKPLLQLLDGCQHREAALQVFELPAQPLSGTHIQASASSLIAQFQKLLEDPRRYNRFRECFLKKAPAVLTDLLAHPVRSHRDARQHLSTLIFQSSGAPDHLMAACTMLAFKAMFSVQEVFDGVFQEPTTVDLLVIAEDPDCTPCFEYIRESGFTHHAAKAIKSTLKLLQKQCDHFLKCLGGKHVSPNRPAGWVMNCRSFGIQDVHCLFAMVRLFVSRISPPSHNKFCVPPSLTFFYCISYSPSQASSLLSPSSHPLKPSEQHHEQFIHELDELYLHNQRLADFEELVKLVPVAIPPFFRKIPTVTHVVQSAAPPTGLDPDSYIPPANDNDFPHNDQPNAPPLPPAVLENDSEDVLKQKITALEQLQQHLQEEHERALKLLNVESRTPV